MLRVNAKGKKKNDEMKLMDMHFTCFSFMLYFYLRPSIIELCSYIFSVVDDY